jgi:signal transduction histidine kinase
LNPEELKGAYEERVRRMGLEIEAREVWLATLSAVAAKTHGCEESKEILDIALSEVLARLNLTAGWVFTGSQGDRKLHFAAARGVSKQYLDTVERVGLAECLCPEVFWTGHRMQARNTTQCPRMPTIVEGLRERVAHACVPLSFEGETRGVLNIAAREGQLFSEDELRFFELLGRQVCVAIARADHLKGERKSNQEAREALERLKGAQDKILEAEKMATLGTFASGLAHEVRNPLNSISLQLSILERRIKRLDSASSKEMENVTEIIRSEISRLDALVGDFLLFSRGNRLHRSMGSLDDLVDDVVRLLEPEAREASIHFERRRASEQKAPGMSMDPERIKQVILNIVRNAFEAIGSGGSVRVETEVLKDEVRVAVHDSGPGLPEGVEIFQLFVTTKAKGTGLGLAIAHQIVTDHGGRITAENAEGGGARFAVALPIHGASEGSGVR